MKYFYLAQAYGEGIYGECTYNDQTSTGTTACPTSGSTGGNPGGLADTGFWVAAVITLACVIVFVALIVRFWKRQPSKSASQEAQQQSSEKHDSTDQ